MSVLLSASDKGDCLHARDLVDPLYHTHTHLLYVIYKNTYKYIIKLIVFISLDAE